MKNMKSAKIAFWISTGLIVTFEGLLPALTFNTPLAKSGISHLGYPDYFRLALTLFKVLGAIALIFPQVPRRIKEWAYAGFTFDFLFAAISHGAIDGVGDFQTWFPLIVLGILAVSYFSLARIRTGNAGFTPNAGFAQG
jgi:hypothetical protein